MEIIKFIIIGIAAGTLSGLVGVGGGVLIVPALIFFFQFTTRQAQGTSLGTLLLPVGIIAVYTFYKNGDLNVRASLLIGLGFLLGGYLGSKINYALPKEYIDYIMGFILIFFGLKMIFKF